jgi:hypothetical protein
LAAAARRRGWPVATLKASSCDAPGDSQWIFYGRTLDAVAVADRFKLALLEPPLDLLSRLPYSLLLRKVEFCAWADIQRVSQPLFIKPADPLDKIFDAGIYHDRNQIRTARTVAPDTALLLSEPVEWLSEYRCFILNRKIAAVSPYLSFGRPISHAPAASALSSTFAVPSPVAAVCDRLFDAIELPPAFVVDIGLIEDRGWAVVEFNPCWCSNLLSANPAKVLDVLDRACIARRDVGDLDRRWLVDRD